MNNTALGEILVAMGALPPEKREEAMSLQRLNGTHTFGEILVKYNLCDQESVDKAVMLQIKLRSKKHHERSQALADVALCSKEAIISMQKQLAEIGRSFLDRSGIPEIPTPILGIPFVLPDRE